MNVLKRAAPWLVSPLLSLAYFWRAWFIWFRIDDFAWLSMPQLIQQPTDLWSALFSPAAQGTVRVLSERLYFLILTSLFGVTAWPFRAVAFLTWFAALYLIQAIGARLTGSRAAGFFAALLWAAHGSLTIPLVWASSYNQLLIAFVVLLAFYARLRWLESGEDKWRLTEAIAFLAGFGVLETIVMYPGLVLLHAALDPHARAKWRSALWMLAPAALFTAAHLFLIPKASGQPYLLVVNGGMFSLLWRYLEWTLAPWRIAALGPTTQFLGRWLFAAIGLALAVYCAARLRRRGSVTPPSEYIRAYRERFGHIFGADDAAELFPEYHASDESRSMLHSAMHDSFRWVRDQAFEAALAEPGAPDRVIFLSGGSCAGKTTIAPSLLVDRPALVYDTTFSNLTGAHAMIQKVLNAGKEVLIVHIRRAIEDSFQANLDRAVHGTGAGRTTNITAMIRSHKGADEVISALAQDSTIEIRAYQHTDSGLERVPLDTLLPRDYTGVDERLRDILEREKDKLPAAVYAAAFGQLGSRDHRGSGQIRGQGRPVHPGLPAIRPQENQAGHFEIILFLGWFLLWIAPVLPLANHVSAYYLTVPGIGIAWLAGSALARALSANLMWRAVAGGLTLGYLIGSAKIIGAETLWYRNRTTEIRVAAHALDAAAMKYPGNILLLNGLGTAAFLDAFPYSMDALLGLGQVWLPPDDNQATEQTGLGDLSRYRTTHEDVFAALERGQLRVISISGDDAIDITDRYHAAQRVRWSAAPGSAIDVGVPAFASRLGPGWFDIDNGARWSGATASLQMEVPVGARTLHITGYAADAVLAAGPVHIDFRAAGSPMGSIAPSTPGPFAFDLPLPAGLTGPATIQLHCSRTYKGDGRELCMIFGTFAAR